MSYEVTGRQPISPDACRISPELSTVQSLMPISAEDRKTLRESIERDGIREPLRGYYGKDESGKRVFFVLSGVNRLEIARELKLPVVPVEVVEIPEADREAFAIDENRARRQLTLEDKRRLAAWLIKKNPAMSNNQAGKLAGIDDKTAGKVRADLESRSEIPNVATRTDSKGRKQAAHKSKQPKNSLSEPTGSPQTSPIAQGKGVVGRGENETALRAFTARLNEALKAVELENVETLTHAVGQAKTWIKDLERKLRSAKS